MGTVGQARELGIADYDYLTVKEISAQLDSLDHGHLMAVRSHESGHKSRVSLLRRIEVLAALTPAAEGNAEGAAGAAEPVNDLNTDRWEPAPAGPSGLRNESRVSLDQGHCTSCGSALSSTRFCGNCGTPVGPNPGSAGKIQLGEITGGRIVASRKGIILVTCIVIGVVAAAILGWKTFGHVTATTHTIQGEMTLTDFDHYLGAKAGTSCYGHGGYDDIHEGAVVRVSDQKGTVIGSGSLGAGTISSDDVPHCVFPINVTGVTDATFFQVEVSHRGQLPFSKSELSEAGWTVHPTLCC